MESSSTVHEIKAKFQSEWLSFLSALGLMSRIPIGLILGKHSLQPEHHNRAQIWYPWVGALLGLVLIVLFMLVPHTWSSLLVAALLLTAWVVFTGALHLDGLADSVDAWVGGMGDAQKTLSIMKGPTSGPMAVVALVVVLLLKAGLIAQLLESDAILLLALVPLLARSWLLPFLYSTGYARKSRFDAQTVQTSEHANWQGGMATDIAYRFPMVSALVSFSVCQLVFVVVLICLSQSLWGWLGINLCALLVLALIRRACINRIGGYTGDVLGAYIELQELIILFALVCL